MMAWYWHGHDGGVGTWLWLAWMVLFWGGLLAAGVYFIRRRPTHVDAGPDAEDVLAERYARATAAPGAGRAPRGPGGRRGARRRALGPLSVARRAWRRAPRRG